MRKDLADMRLTTLAISSAISHSLVSLCSTALITMLTTVPDARKTAEQAYQAYLGTYTYIHYI